MFLGVLFSTHLSVSKKLVSKYHHTCEKLVHIFFDCNFNNFFLILDKMINFLIEVTEKMAANRRSAYIRPQHNSANQVVLWPGEPDRAVWTPVQQGKSQPRPYGLGWAVNMGYYGLQPRGPKTRGAPSCTFLLNRHGNEGPQILLAQGSLKA